nr:hypothetical protein [Kibdelosporangium sp. MJ126-NF4]CTQ98490.1 hypothetical protein [Kibdelosporangium sp. MJ126-NF4]
MGVDRNSCGHSRSSWWGMGADCLGRTAWRTGENPWDTRTD